MEIGNLAKLQDLQLFGNPLITGWLRVYEPVLHQRAPTNRDPFPCTDKKKTQAALKAKLPQCKILV